MIKKIKILSDDLHVYFNESDEIFSNIWLRDHARDEETGITDLVKGKHLQQL
tara:strand:- start:113 stop:268 length:156 start_codon:yes stop_codon:yes gene_type:complete